MSTYDRERFDSALDIPDPVRPDQLLTRQPDLWAPVVEGLDVNTSVAAVEVAYTYLDSDASTPGGARTCFHPTGRI